MSTNYGFIGDLLIRTGAVDAASVARAIDAQAGRPIALAKALHELGLADEGATTSAIAGALRLEYLEAEPAVGPDMIALLPPEFCRKRRVLPLRVDGNRLRLAVVDPADYVVVQDIEFRSGKKTTPVVVTQTWMERMLPRVYPEAEPEAVAYEKLTTVNPAGEVEATVENEYEVVDPALLAKDTKLPPIVKLVNLILSDAAKAGASDVHIEPQETVLHVRFRIDGMLREMLTVPQQLKDQTISRFKIISGMDIAERRKPQDGRSRLRFEGRRIDLRVSTLPTQFGEKVVIRLLASGKAVQAIDQIDLAPDYLRLMRSFLSHPQGMILVTGPTGSGKTSTLYTALNSIKSPTNNIVTLEDPIEIQLPGVNQIQINTKAGVTFANGLRSILRQDPNIILVGEIRDQETAEIALQAAQTGHLLLSTLHTNDAPSTITRLADLGIQPFLISSSLLGVVAQRLVRRVCPACAVPAELDPHVVERAGGAARLPQGARWMAGAGCDKCGQAGTKGRIAIHEMLEINDEVRELISSKAGEQAIRRAGKRNGMRTLFEDGLMKAAQGLTTLEEVLRVVSRDDSDDVRPSPVSVAVPSAPIAAAPVAPVAPAAPATPVMPVTIDAAEPTADAASDAGTARRRVLVVEDSPTVSSVVKYFLEIEGFEVLVAADGRVGLELALAEHPDVIVSDVAMPAMNGVEMVAALRADARTADVRILMLTADGSVESEAQGLEAGADDYIVKPVEPRRLAARVKALLMRRRSRAA